MDLSHMMAIGLLGQSAGVAPGGCAVLYAPTPEGRERQQTGVSVYPFSSDRLALPGGVMGAMHAGLGLIGELEYGPDGLAGFVPRLFSAVHLPAPMAVNDGSPIGAQVNRGADTIGLSDRLQFVDRFDAGGVLGRARVAGWVERAGAGGELVQSCEDVAAGSFPVMFEKFVDYLRFAVSAQVAGNGYDDLAGALAQSDRPTHAVVVVGVSSTDPHLQGDQARLMPGDVCHSVVYDSDVASLDAIAQALRAGEAGSVLGAEGVSWLRQVVA